MDITNVLFTQYRNSLNTESSCSLVANRLEIGSSCAESARWCLSQIDTRGSSVIFLDVAKFVFNGLHMDPFSGECYDVLFELLEAEIKKASEKKEKVDLAELAEKDINASPVLEEWLQKLYPEGPPVNDQ